MNNDRVIDFTLIAGKAKEGILIIFVDVSRKPSALPPMGKPALRNVPPGHCNIHSWDSGTWRKGGQEASGCQGMTVTPDLDHNTHAQPEVWTCCVTGNQGQENVHLNGQTCLKYKPLGVPGWLSPLSSQLQLKP